MFCSTAATEISVGLWYHSGQNIVRLWDKQALCGCLSGFLQALERASEGNEKRARESTGISEKQDHVFAVKLWYYASLIPYNKILACYNPCSYFLSAKQWFTKTWSQAPALSSPPQCSISIFLMQRTLLGTIRCLAGGHLPGDECSFPHCQLGLCILIAFKLVRLPGQKNAVLRISCCKCMCDSSPWSIYSSWLGNSKPLSLRTGHDLIYLKRVLSRLIKFSVSSSPPSIISFQEGDEDLSTAPLYCGCFFVQGSALPLCAQDKGSVLMDSW